MANLKLQRALIRTIEEQLDRNQPSYVLDTYLELIHRGFEDRQIKRWFAACFLSSLTSEEKQLQPNWGHYEQEIKNLLVDHQHSIPQIYRFQVTLEKTSVEISRIIDIPSHFTLADLACTILVSCHATQAHLYHFLQDDNLYDCMLTHEESESNPYVESATITKLYELSYDPTIPLELHYDTVLDWTFTIKRIAVIEPEAFQQEEYPLIIEGVGKQILENIAPQELEAALIKRKQGTFQLKVINRHLPQKVEQLKEEYED